MFLIIAIIIAVVATAKLANTTKTELEKVVASGLVFGFCAIQVAVLVMLPSVDGVEACTFILSVLTGLVAVAITGCESHPNK